MVYGIYEAGRNDERGLGLSGIGRSNEAPEAVVETESTLGRIGELLELSGAASNDPEGDPLSFEWRFVSIPRASTLELFEASSELLYSMPDVAGLYEIELTVTDSVGASDSEVVGFDIGMGDSIQVDLIWDPTLGDLDLHHIPEGNALFSPDNCSFQTPSVMQIWTVPWMKMPLSILAMMRGSEESSESLSAVRHDRWRLRCGCKCFCHQCAS